MRLVITALFTALVAAFFLPGCAGGAVAVYDEGHRGHYYSTYNNAPDYRIYRYHRWDNTQPVPRNPYSNDPGTAIRNDLHVRDW